jgi:uncharacterized protein (TIGR00299 family) protein
MILGALVDAGLPPEVLQSVPGRLDLEGVRITADRAMKGAISATKVTVETTEAHPHRHLSHIMSKLEAADLPEPVRARAASIFQRLGEAEAAIHNQPVESVHLHEVGGVDAMVDICGAALGLHEMGIEQIAAGPFPLGQGTTHSMHGQIPVPAPATLALLRGAPVVHRHVQAELVTPTGAAVISTLTEHYGPCPPMTLTAVGYGAGGRDTQMPNVLRVWLGESTQEEGIRSEALVSLETNIDDTNPQVYDHLTERLFDAGALDVTLTPIVMKKQRPAVTLSVLAAPGDAPHLRTILFREGVTLGVRETLVQRHCLPREVVSVQTPYGDVRVKVAQYEGEIVRAAPEYDDCQAAASANGVPLLEVFAAAARAYEAAR